MPVVMAPVGLAGLMRQRGEVQALAREPAASFHRGRLICSLEEVPRPQRPFWFQLPNEKDPFRGGSNGPRWVSYLVFTVDLAVVGATGTPGGMVAAPRGRYA
jgi:L-lactate dehydrogenase (cytochrome)